MSQDYGFFFNGARVGPSTYGADYVPELINILENFPTANPRHVLEWGSGITTQVLADFAANRWHSNLLLSIDENAAYQEAIFAGRSKPSCLKLKAIDLIGPGTSQRDPEFNFSTYPLVFGQKFDVIFIDARRRMECAFIAALLSYSDTTVIIHDYRRTRYQPIVALFDILQDGSQYRVLRPRPVVLDAIECGVRSIEMYVNCLKFNGYFPQD
jgi:hypothetical protein